MSASQQPTTSVGETVTIKGGCHCGNVTYTLDLDLGADRKQPAAAYFCHCEDCRLTLGSLCSLIAPIPKKLKVTLRDGEDSVRTYRTKNHGVVEFCAVCGTSFQLEQAVTSEDADSLNAESAIFVPTISLRGTFPDSDGPLDLWDVFKPRAHIAVNQTLSGGVSKILDIDGPKYFGFYVTRKSTYDETDEVKHPTEKDGESTKGSDALQGKCRCGQVSFTISRPPESFAKDVVLSQWVKPGRQLCAGHCFCDSCRISGSPFWSWAFLPRKLIEFEPESESRLKTYSSSPGVSRKFCGKCGCHVFYDCRGDMWDVAVGTLDPAAVARDGWLVWRYDSALPVLEVDRYIEGRMEGRCSFDDDGRAYQPQLVRLVDEGKKASGLF